jgi:hypothetical protein
MAMREERSDERQLRLQTYPILAVHPVTSDQHVVDGLSGAADLQMGACFVLTKSAPDQSCRGRNTGVLKVAPTTTTVLMLGY